ncbi:hypothetical protein PFISCL1PPCAC_20737, partial [Pristionchus fissidentatus]
LKMNLCCERQSLSSMWSSEMRAQFVVESFDGKRDLLVKQVEAKFDYENHEIKVEMATWKQLLELSKDPEMVGYECRLFIQKISGV